MRAGTYVLWTVIWLCGVLLAAGCSDDKSPTMPSAPASITISGSTPAPGSTLTPIGTPPGTFFQRGSGAFGVTISVTGGAELPFAQLAVFLATSDPVSPCGQNLPDWPTWQPFAKGQTINYTVTGFQVFRLPCEVTGIRAIFNTRTDVHLGGIPPADQIVADTTLPVVYHLRQ
ncbi:MAG: hypothetical protein ACRD2I_02490 [Vicinamibacterales bacterium]